MSTEEDYWKEPEFDPSQVTSPFFEESEFKILIPDYRLTYIQEIWPRIKDVVKTKELAADLDLVKKTMTIKTTKKTRDPFIIIRGRDLLKLISRGVPFINAKRILEDESSFCEIVKIGGIITNKERFARRRQRLIGPNCSTLKAIELLTQCYICVNGQTVACIGPWKGIKKARKIILDCMNNIHPVYALKSLMVERELANNPELTDKDWSSYLPHYKKPHQTKEQRQGKSRESRKDTNTKGHHSHKEGKGKDQDRPRSVLKKKSKTK